MLKDTNIVTPYIKYGSNMESTPKISLKHL